MRTVAGAIFPELESNCKSFLRHKTTLLSPAVFKSSNIPCYSVLQTAGTFVIVLASAFHFGYNQGQNCAEAVNFGLSSWLPKGCTAVPCTCDGNQTPHIDVPLLMRRVKAEDPDKTADWWCFCCACGLTCTNFDPPSEAPEGEQFECVTCGNWGHIDCYPAYQKAAAEGTLPEKLYCVACTDAWRDGDHAEEGWKFSCLCGRNEGASHESAAAGDAPTGRMFQCSSCDVWSHTECYASYRDVEDEELPETMLCHRCGGKGSGGGGSKAKMPHRGAVGKKRSVPPVTHVTPDAKRVSGSVATTPPRVKAAYQLTELCRLAASPANDTRVHGVAHGHEGAAKAESNTRFICKYPQCGRVYASTDAVRKHCRLRHSEWLSQFRHGCPSQYCDRIDGATT